MVERIVRMGVFELFWILCIWFLIFIRYELIEIVVNCEEYRLYGFIGGCGVVLVSIFLVEEWRESGVFMWGNEVDLSGFYRNGRGNF